MNLQIAHCRYDAARAHEPMREEKFGRLSVVVPVNAFFSYFCISASPLYGGGRIEVPVTIGNAGQHIFFTRLWVTLSTWWSLNIVR